MLTGCPELLQHKKRVLFDSPLHPRSQLTPIPTKPSFVKALLNQHITLRLSYQPTYHLATTQPPHKPYSQNDFNFNLILLHQLDLQKCLKGAPKHSSANSAQPPPPPSPTPPPLPPPPPHPRRPQAPRAPKSPSAPSTPPTTAATSYPTGALHQSVPPPSPCRLLPVSAVPLTQWMAKASTSPANVTFSEGTRKTPK
jgi:hypothetical protein